MGRDAANQMAEGKGWGGIAREQGTETIVLRKEGVNLKGGYGHENLSTFMEK